LHFYCNYSLFAFIIGQLLLILQTSVLHTLDSFQQLNWLLSFFFFRLSVMSALSCVFKTNKHVTKVAFAPHPQDNKPCLALGQDNGEIALLMPAALRKGEGSYKLQGHKISVNSVALSSGQEQQLLASGSANKTVRLWDTHTRECVAVLEGHTGCVDRVTFSPNGRLLASASRDRTVRLWDVVGRQPASPVHVLQAHTWVSSMTFSPDERQLASADDHTVRLWSVPEGVPGPVLQHASSVHCVVFSPVVGSNMLASGSWDLSLMQSDI
jgi:WD40 repeat protein